MGDMVKDWLRPMFAELFPLHVKYVGASKEYRNSDHFYADLIADTKAFTDKFATAENHYATRLAAALIDLVDDMDKGLMPYCSTGRKTRELYQAMLEVRQ